MASPSSRVEPVKILSTATTTLCELVSPIDSFTLAANINYKCNAVLYEFTMPFDGGTKKQNWKCRIPYLVHKITNNILKVH